MSEAMDMAEEFVNQADEPLEQVKIVAREARKIANLPRYIDQRLIRLIGDIKRVDYVKAAIKSVRNSLPDGALEAERRSVEDGSQAILKCKNTAILGSLMPAGTPQSYPKLITKGGDKYGLVGQTFWDRNQKRRDYEDGASGDERTWKGDDKDG